MHMESWPQRIKQRMKELGIKRKKIAKVLDISEGAVGHYLTGRNGPSPEGFIILKDLLECSLDWLLTGQPPMKSSELSDASQSARLIPVINSLQAGIQEETIASSGTEAIIVDSELADQLSSETFAMRVEGESMAPIFNPGDIVVVDPDATLKPGCIVVARLDTDDAAILRKYRSRGVNVFELVPLNDDYPTVIVDADNPGKIIGPVVEHRRRLLV